MTGSTRQGYQIIEDWKAARISPFLKQSRNDAVKLFPANNAKYRNGIPFYRKYRSVVSNPEAIEGSFNPFYLLDSLPVGSDTHFQPVDLSEGISLDGFWQGFDVLFGSPGESNPILQRLIPALSLQGISPCPLFSL